MDEPRPNPAFAQADLLDVQLTLSVELGRTSVSIERVLDLSSGAVVELDRIAGEPLDILLNGRVVARGEAVVVGDRLGVRVTGLARNLERLRSH